MHVIALQHCRAHGAEHAGEQERVRAQQKPHVRRCRLLQQRVVDGAHHTDAELREQHAARNAHVHAEHVRRRFRVHAQEHNANEDVGRLQQRPHARLERRRDLVRHSALRARRQRRRVREHQVAHAAAQLNKPTRKLRAFLTYALCASSLS